MRHVVNVMTMTSLPDPSATHHAVSVRSDWSHALHHHMLGLGALTSFSTKFKQMLTYICLLLAYHLCPGNIVAKPVGSV